MDWKYPIVIDGGISNELEKLGCDLNHKLWTARLLDSGDDAIKAVHLNYMRAGAQFVSSVSYQASIQGLMENGSSHSDAVSLLIKSIDLLEDARISFYNENTNAQKVYIVASIGPYGAYKADGSEYKGNYDLSYEDLVQFHQERLKIFSKSKADIIAFETIPDSLEAHVIHDLTLDIKKPCWISFSCHDDNHISDGTPLSEMGELFKNHPAVFAIGANCIPPEYVSGILNSLSKSAEEKRIIIYPNSGGNYNSTDKKWYANQKKLSLKDMADDWLEQGADIIGGCCKVGAEEISELSHHIHN